MGYPSLAEYYKKSFEEIGNEVDVVSFSPASKMWIRILVSGAIMKISRRLWNWIEAKMIEYRFGKILKKREKYDLAVIFKGTGVTRRILSRLRREGIMLFHYYPDDHMHPNFTSPTALESIPDYDCILTPLPINISELNEKGAKRAEYLPFGYYPTIHHPVRVENKEDCTDVVFVGNRRPDRVEVLTHLVRSIPGIKMKIYGYGWNRVPRNSPIIPFLVNSYLGGEEMARVFSASSIVIGFVVHFGGNRTMHPMRAFEIPACGGFLLAERANGEYLEFFEEGSEIATWGDPEELIDKTKYYLEHEGIRRKMARRAFERVKKDGHSYIDRAKKILALHEEILEKKES